MRHPAALPAVGIASGLALGHLTSLDPTLWAAAALLATAASIIGLAVRRRVIVMGAVSLGFVSGAAALARLDAAAVDRPPLRAWFDRHADPRTGRCELAWIEGRLRTDASVTEFGAHFDLDVSRAETSGRTEPVRG